MNLSPAQIEAEYLKKKNQCQITNYPLIKDLLWSLPTDLQVHIFTGAWCDSIIFEVETRADMAVIKGVCNKLCPHTASDPWAKSCGYNQSSPCVTYSKNISPDFQVVIQPKELPATCKLIERTVVEPAKPEKVITTKTLDCNFDEPEV